MSLSNRVYKDVEFTEENSVQYSHYLFGNDAKFFKFLKKHNLRIESRDDQNGYYHEGEALSEYVVAPIFDKDGNKLCWGTYHTPEWEVYAKFKTKKAAMNEIKDLYRYSNYDDEFNEYGLLMDSGCPDPVGFR